MKNQQKTIVKKLILATISLLIYDVLETIWYISAIFDLMMFAKYILHNNKKL